MSDLIGTWELVSSENLDGYLKALRVPYVWRRAARLVRPVLEIRNEEKRWWIKTMTKLKDTELVAEEDEEFDESISEYLCLFVSFRSLLSNSYTR